MKKSIVIAGLIVIAGYLAWGQFSKPRGEQKVDYTPAHKESSVDGPLRYCVYRAVGGVNEDIVYHLHGRYLDENTWNDDTYFTSMVQAHWQRSKQKPPTVVTVSYGPAWLLTPKGKADGSGLLDDFIHRLPRIEAKIGTPKRRMVVGESMGGLNSLILGLSRPNLFSKVASLSPGVYNHSPFSSLAVLKTAAARTGADPKIIFWILQFAKKYITNEEEWNLISPIRLINQANETYPELYISCGLYDKYGNFEGSQILAEKATKNGVKTIWRPIYGGHGAVDVASLADFLVGR